MADDNFEDDLFADLYTDEDDGSKAAAAPAVVKSVPQVVSSTSEVKAEEPPTNPDEYAEDDQQMYNDQGDDDEIDFNLGNGNGHTESRDYDEGPSQQRHGPGIKEDGKMFIGGLNWETTDESLKNYFSQFGEVAECTVMRDGASGRSRGFGFLTFKDAKTVNIVMVKEHYLDGKIIDPKRAIPRDEQEKTSKIFVGGVSQEASEQDFKEYFMQFGRVIDATLMMDKDTGRPRGFGFVTFDSEAAVELCLQQPLEIHGKAIEVKKAQPRGNMREEEENNRNNRNNRFRKDEGSSNQGMLQNNAMAGAPAGMTPQVMAQYWQRMQQAFVMMQQQMAMGRGMGGNMQMNPAMMAQMAQMQQMQAAAMGNAANSSGGGMNMAQNMNPAMMQQMQQMQQMQGGMGMGQGNMGLGQGMGGASGGASNPGGNRGTPGYNAYQQQMFEQQKYDQQQKRGGMGGGQGYGQAIGYGNGGGGPTSWEGMYDDVPQPNVAGGGGARGGFGGNRGGSQRGSVPPTGPAPAPPAGAPTGPKNAGKPGANYRGGGRGGRGGGFHPYSRGS